MKTRSVIFFLAFAFCINVNVTNAQVNVRDSLALVDLYNSTNGVEWHHKAGWLTNKPVSKWYGITVTKKRVTEIVLEFNHLQNNIPSSIGKLENLQNLSLGYNQLSGHIPFSIGKLVNLQNLNIGSNNLSGSIPSSIGDLVNLRNLTLWFNQLSGNIPSSIGNLINLTEIDFNYNNLSGSIPSALGNLVNLRYLFLYNNKLSGGIPVSFGNLKHLDWLNLSNNSLSGSIPGSLGNLKHLDWLILSNNRLSGSIPSSFGNFIDLVFLDLHNNRLSGTIPSSLSNLSDRALSLLDLSHNNFTFDGIEVIAQRFSYQPKYHNQKRIPIHQNGNTLSVSAGGTLSNNTFKWYQYKQAGDTVVIKGDSVFHPKESGTYLVRVQNSVATLLTLFSDTIVYTARNERVMAFSENTLQQYDKRKLSSVYPNPAKDILYVQTNNNATFSLLDQSGKTVLSANISSKGSINISNLNAGLYYLRNNSSGLVQKVVIER